MTSRPVPRRSATTGRSDIPSPVLPNSPRSARQLSRSPDATPVPGNPNPKLASGIPSLSQASRRITAPPSAFTKISDLVMTPGTGKSPVTPQRTSGLSKRTPSSAGGPGVRSRTTSLQSNGLSVRGNGAPPSVTGRSQRSVSMQLGKAPGKSPVVQRTSADRTGRPSMESVTVVAPPEKRPSPSPQPLQPNPNSPINERRSPNVSRATPPTPISKTTSPKVSTPRSPAPALHITQEYQSTPKSTPSKARPPPPAKLALGDRPVSSASSNLPGVPWTSSGTLHPPPPNGNMHLNGSVNGRSQLRGSGGKDSYMSRSMGPGVYGDEDYVQDEQYEEGGTDYDGGMTLDMVTEVDETEFDEDLQAAFNDLQMIFMTKLIHYKRLLEQAQASSASQLHALQAELRLLRVQVESERKATRDLEIRAGKDREALFTERRHRSQLQLDASGGGGNIFDVAALRGDGRGSFDEAEVKRAVRGLRMTDRMRLIHLILDSCLPGDISQMIRLLEKYAASTFDIISMLPPELGARILSYLNVHELLEVEVVSKGWQAVVHHPSIWRRLCLQLTWSDPVPLKWPKNANDWEPLYRSLHHRERNWVSGVAQSVRFLRGHTNFCTTLILKGNRLISGSYDETIRVWDVSSGRETHCLKAKAISCLDFLPEEEVLVAGFHDIGRVQVFSTVTWTLLQTLQGHLYGIRSVAMSKKYVVSAGADKALVCWDWRSGQKLVRFGQQTNLNIGVQIVNDETVVGVTVDGIVRTFSIRRKEMISQFKLNELAVGDPIMSARLAPVGVGANNMLQWFAAKGRQMTCATKNVILHLEWPEGMFSESKGRAEPSSPMSTIDSFSPSTSRLRSSLGRSTTSPAVTSPLSTRKSLAASRPPPSPRDSNVSRLSMSTSGPHSPAKALISIPPRLLSVIETPDVAVGAVDPLKRRVTTATRFSSRAGADRRIFVSTYNEVRKPRTPIEEDGELPSPSEASVDLETGIAPIGGAWASLADGPPLAGTPAIGPLPPDFKGLATPGLNPMSMALSHEKVVVGCADGTIYVMSFVGHQYTAPLPIDEPLFDEY